MPNLQTPTLANAQGHVFPNMTAIAVEYWKNDQRWIADRICPVFQTTQALNRITRWSAADALPVLQAAILRAKGDTGAEIGIFSPTYEDFFINEGMLKSKVLHREVNEAPTNDKDRPYRVRTKLATGFLKLENEMRVKSYFDPTDPLFPSAQLVAPSGNWQTAAAADRIISTDWRNGVNLFKKVSGGLAPNFVILDPTTDVFFLDKLAAERNTMVAVGGYGQTPDLLPSADGLRLNGATIIIPGSVKETTPDDAVYSPDYAWGDFPYAVFGYSPTFAGGGLWDQSGEAYITNGEFVPDGEVAFETYRQTDPIVMNKQDFMWWNFNRQIKLLKPELVLAIGPIR